MSHSTHSYAPLDSTTPYQTEHSPSTPPPLYSDHGPAPNSGSPSKGGYRPESMLYSKQESSSPYLSGSGDASSASLLPQSERDIPEKDITSVSKYDDTYNDIDTSYAPVGGDSSSNIRSRGFSPSPSRKEPHHYKGKRWLLFTRTLFACLNLFISAAAFIAIALVIWGTYTKNKDKTRLTLSGPNKPKTVIRAFPKDIDPLPNNLLIASSLVTMFLSFIGSLAPCWRSIKHFHKKRFSKSEIYEIIVNIIIVAAGAPAAYFATTGKSDLNRSLWGYTCEIARSTKEPQRLVFTEITYRNNCNNYGAAVYLVMTFTGFAALTLASFLINFCLKKKKGEFRHNESDLCVNICDCCGAIAGPIVDCAIVCQCCFACCRLFD
ncbi:hypothetical protein TWF718_004576 [Orbilia javanica]|uniref:Uncharacterized protein n=1 Tax=Orbilia javanica TaxID=47235 RepID=A0AAN8RFM9_9PEZI